MKHIEREHTIEIALPVAEAFPLFTPLGEMRWIDDWRPEFIHPADGETMEGMVFKTGAGTEETLWSCIDYAPAEHRIRYARVTPASRFAHVSVNCTQIGSNSTRVAVNYAMTALNAAGEAKLAATTEDAFRASIEGWKTLIQTRIIEG